MKHTGYARPGPAPAAGEPPRAEAPGLPDQAGLPAPEGAAIGVPWADPEPDISSPPALLG